MVETVSIYLAFLAVSAVISTSLAIYTYRKFWVKNKIKPAGMLAGILAASSIWTIAILFAFISKTQSSIYFWEQFKYVGIVFIAPSWLVVALSWTGRGNWENKKLVLFYIIPIIGLFFTFTDPWHHLFWSTSNFISFESYLLFAGDHGIAWWFFTTYAYVMIIIGSFYLILGISTLKHIYRKQAFILLLGSILPIAANVISSINTWGSVFDFTPILVALSSIAYIWGFSSMKFIEIIPFAKDAMFNYLGDPVFVFDSQNHLVDLNPAAEKTFTISAKVCFGEKIDNIFSSYPSVLQSYKENKTVSEVSIKKNNQKYYYDLHINPLIEDGTKTGSLFSFRDISERKKTEERFSVVYKSSPIMICLSTLDEGRFVDINDAFLERTKWTRKDVLGKTSFDIGFWAHPAKEQRRTFLNHLKKHKMIQNENFIFQDKNKNIIHGLLSAQCITIDNKDYILTNIVDITKQKNAEQTTQRQLAAFRSSMDGIAIFDQNNEFIYLNDAFRNMFGYKNTGDLFGKEIEVIVTKEMLKQYHDEVEPEFEKKGQWRGETIGKKADSSTLNLEITLTKLDEGGFICISRDITKQKMVMKELEDAHEVLFTINKDLERKVKQRTNEIEQLVKQKDDFINQLGHDLKTPLTPMMVLMPILKKKAKSKKDEELFDVIIRNTQFMKDLVNKTINLAKLNSDKIEFNIEPINLSEEIDYVIKNNRFILDDNHIKIENNTNKNIIVDADRIQLQELLNNLITNAIKYSPEEGGSIFMHTTEHNDEVTVAVEDTGIGMTKEQTEKIFLEFFKADDSRHDLDSSGLGLNICKRIVEKHGGKIWAESAGKGNGSTFYFTLKKGKQNALESAEKEMEIA